MSQEPTSAATGRNSLATRTEVKGVCCHHVATKNGGRFKVQSPREKPLARPMARNGTNASKVLYIARNGRGPRRVGVRGGPTRLIAMCPRWRIADVCIRTGRGGGAVGRCEALAGRRWSLGCRSGSRDLCPLGARLSCARCAATHPFTRPVSRLHGAGHVRRQFPRRFCGNPGAVETHQYVLQLRRRGHAAVLFCGGIRLSAHLSASGGEGMA